MEIFDIVDEYGNPTGEKIERGLAHKEGVRHRTAHIWIAREVNGKWQVHLTLSMKKSFMISCLRIMK